MTAPDVEWELRRLHRDQESVLEDEWQVRSAIESDRNVAVQWVRTFDAADVDLMAGRLWFPYGEWGWMR